DHAQTMVNNISNAEIHINDDPNPTVESITANSRALVEEKKPDIIFIDYLEMLAANIGEPETRLQECAHILEELKTLASELNLPIVVFSQISGSSTHQRPAIHDVSENLNAKAQNLLLLHRHFDTTVNGHQGNTEILIARDSATQKPGKVMIKFIESIDKFVNVEVE
ncbi:MAG: DnaB-like helicase C-terminal domain-containing protein, partial [Bacteroidota bacterium]